MRRFRQIREMIASQILPQEVLVKWQILARTFLRLGITGFGGGIAVIAQIRRIVVREHRWLSDEEFLDAVSLAQSLPGANATNAITYVGLKLAGVRGAMISAVSFVLPSFVMMVGLTIAHNHLHHLPDVQRVFQGLNAAVVGLIAATAVRLGKTAMLQQWHLELGVVAGFILIFTDASVTEVVLLAGMIGIFIRSLKVRARHRIQQLRKHRQSGARTAVAEHHARQQAAESMAQPGNLAADFRVGVSLPATNTEGPETVVDAQQRSQESSPLSKSDAGATKPQAEESQSTKRLLALAIPIFTLPLFMKFITIWQLVMVFLRVGSVTFGGGFVMIPQIETDVVKVHRWMTQQAFADGVVFGQVTPGPVLITATFIGYKVAGLLGAVAATIAAFLPSFLMTLIAGTSLNRFRTNQQVQAFLSGVAPAVVGMLTAATVSLARSGLHSTLSFGIATFAFLLMLRARLNPFIIIFGCGLLQFVLSRYVIH